MSRIEVTTTATLLDSATGSEYQAQDILIMAEASNAATIYVGTTSAVTLLVDNEYV